MTLRCGGFLITGMLRLLFLLFAGHALCDFPLQGEFLSNYKNPRGRISDVPWQWCLFAHVLIQGAMVYLVTGSLALGCAEVAVHALIDWAKCQRWFNFSADQLLHYGFKVLWALLVVFPPHL